jgi:dipeptidyl aminopeptidase/acylaminoacyl peptidase
MRLAAPIALVLALHGVASAAPPPPLIDRELLLGNPERTQPRIAPDGKHIAYLAPDKKDVLQVWVRTVGASDDKAITADKKRGIRAYAWAQGGKMVLYGQDADGDENWHIYGADLASGAVRDYTPWQGARALIADVSPRYPDTILVGVNQRDPKVSDVYRVDLRSGATTLDTQNPGDVADWTVDAKQQVRGAQVRLRDGGTEIRVRDTVKAPWRTLLKAPREESVDLIGFDPTGREILLETSEGADTQRLVARDVKSGKLRELARDDEVDAGQVVEHPLRRTLVAVSFFKGRRSWVVLDPKYKDDFAELAKLSPGDLAYLSQDDGDKVWLVGFARADGPMRFYSWDRAAKKGTPLFTDRPKLEQAKLAEMEPVTFPARDGVTLHGYLTRPVGASGAGPMVVWVHGGPWARDHWGYSGYVQLLANRGYAVLQVNYRGSTGYGKKFLHLGDKQWGKAMHTDLVDGVQWAVKQGVADPKRIAIGGGSYGGYAALAGAAFTPDTFRCAVDIVGPSNLATLLHSIPPYWEPERAVFTTRMGDPDDPAQAEAMRASSPLFSADKIRIPMLIGQGANDPRVKMAESEQIVAAIAKHGGRATYVLYSDEGHGFARPPNNLDFAGRVETFLAAQLGGRAQPLAGERQPGSTAQVREVGAPAPAKRAAR